MTESPPSRPQTGSANPFATPPRSRTTCRTPGAPSWPSSRDEPNIQFQVHVNSLAGKLCSIVVAHQWSVIRLKVAIESEIGVPVAEQQLIIGQSELFDVEKLRHFLDHGLNNIYLVRRSPKQLAVLERVAQMTPVELCDFMKSEEVESDRGIAIAAVLRDGSLLSLVSGPLLEDRDVILAALCSKIQPAACKNVLRLAHANVRADCQFMLRACQICEGLLQLADERLKEDRDFMLSCITTTTERNIEFLLANPRCALSRLQEVLQWVSPKLLKDHEFCEAAGLARPSTRRVKSRSRSRYLSPRLNDSPFASENMLQSCAL